MVWGFKDGFYLKQNVSKVGQTMFHWSTLKWAQGMTFSFKLFLGAFLTFLDIKSVKLRKTSFAEEYSQSSQTSKIEVSAKVFSSYFSKKLHLMCLTSYWMPLCRTNIICSKVCRFFVHWPLLHQLFVIFEQAPVKLWYFIPNI